MALSPGTKLGPYEIVSLVGAGGMGQVYKARDTRLDRIVALKLLPPDLAERPDRRRRFEVEARAVSSLSHPHICSLFDVGESDGRPFLVMEYLEGETLDDRLSRGALSSFEVLRYGAQIADALDHAHRGQIVHRDLKPSNVMLTESGVKLLDFGLAKGVAPASPGLNTTVSFDERKLTAEGSLIGTFQYMAPEQIEGKPVDVRTDIFALGVLLYEMATGAKAFEGESHASLIASILTAQPPRISSARQTAPHDSLPQSLDHIVERCLAKNPLERWQTARDVKTELEWAGKAESSAPGVSRVRSTARIRNALPWVVTVIAVAIAIAVAAGLVSRRTAPPETTRFTIAPPGGGYIGYAQNQLRLALSPDGSRLAFVAWKDGVQRIWIRNRDDLEARPLVGTENGRLPFWSPDSRFLAFFSGDGELKKIEASGGPPITICAAQIEGTATWGEDGTILFTQFRDGIHRVSSNGGTPVRVTQVDKSKHQMNHYWPSFLPDGRRFFYLATSIDANGVRQTPTIYVASLDSPDVSAVATLPSRVISAGPGRVLYVQDGVLMSQQFDEKSLRLIGTPTTIADGVSYNRSLGTAQFAISNRGTLAYLGNRELARVVSYDRQGNETDVGWQLENYGALRVSPDGQRVAVDVRELRTGLSDIRIYDVARGAPIRFTTDGYGSDPVWSPDGRRLAFSSGRSQAPRVLSRSLESEEEEVLADMASPLAAEDWSRDGNWMAFTNTTRARRADLFLVPLSGDRKPRTFAGTTSNEFDAKFSPDSRWVAFVSDEFVRPEVYVMSVAGGDKTAISVEGGSSPRWRADGKELYYVAADNRTMMAVPVESGSQFKAGVPRRLFNLREEVASRIGFRNASYDVFPDGQRFVVILPAEAGTSQITMVLNWTAMLGTERE